MLYVIHMVIIFKQRLNLNEKKKNAAYKYHLWLKGHSLPLTHFADL